MDYTNKDGTLKTWVKLQEIEAVTGIGKGTLLRRIKAGSLPSFWDNQQNCYFVAREDALKILPIKRPPGMVCNLPTDSRQYILGELERLQAMTADLNHTIKYLFEYVKTPQNTAK